MADDPGSPVPLGEAMVFLEWDKKMQFINILCMGA